MAPSPVCGLMMRNLLVSVILGLLAVVHTTPLNTVTQIPSKDIQDDEFLIVDPASFPSLLTTESPKRNTTVHTSQQPSSDFEGSGMEESTTAMFFQHGSDNYLTTTPSVSHAQSSPSTVSSRDTDNFTSESSVSHSPESGFSSSSVPNEAQPSITPDHIAGSKTTDPAVFSYESLTTDSVFGSGDAPDHYASTSSSMTSSSYTETTETSTVPSTSTTAVDEDKESYGSGSTEETTTAASTSITAVYHNEDENFDGSGSTTETTTASSASTTAVYHNEDENFDGSGSTTETTTAASTSTTVKHDGSEQFVLDSSTTQSPESFSETKEIMPSVVASFGALQEVNINASPQNPENKTSGWIIIVGFIVGVIALVVLCVAIATRDKWNGPKQASQREDRNGSSNQQRELEMETFLHKEKPKESGQAAEYTVIPLDELPENYSSH